MLNNYYLFKNHVPALPRDDDAAISEDTDDDCDCAFNLRELSLAIYAIVILQFNSVTTTCSRDCNTQ